MLTMGERLRDLRVAKGYSQNDMAKFLGVSRPAYVSYETNRYKPSKFLPELASLLGTTIPYLLGVENSCDVNTNPVTPTLPYSDEALEIARMYDIVDRRGQGNIKSVVEREYNLTIESKTEDVGQSC